MIQDAHVVPTRENLTAFMALPRETTIEMLNLIRYRERADYPADHGHAERNWTGEEAYCEYGRAIAPVLARVGARTLWRGRMESMMIGPVGERWDNAFITRFPNALAFLALVSDPAYQLAVVHRHAAVLNSRLLRFAPLEAGFWFGSEGEEEPNL